MTDIEERLKEFKELIIPELTRGELEERVYQFYERILYQQDVLDKIDKLISFDNGLI